MYHFVFHFVNISFFHVRISFFFVAFYISLFFQMAATTETHCHILNTPSSRLSLYCFTLCRIGHFVQTDSHLWRVRHTFKWKCVYEVPRRHRRKKKLICKITIYFCFFLFFVVATLRPEPCIVCLRSIER